MNVYELTNEGTPEPLFVEADSPENAIEMVIGRGFMRQVTNPPSDSPYNHGT